MGRAKPEVMKALKKFREGVRKYGVEKILLFGSQTTGKAGESSDVDLIIISRERDKLKLLSKLYHEWHLVQEIDFPVDFICYTPEEFEKLKGQVTIVREAVRTGVSVEV
ncbi:MAG: nucleotidyltransferase domain-containing protein [Candidatus Hadarchaeota archaeon]|nr:nucleotidyltransferase domain-containing protein [Candidatus Hadarchaeota archaeon]